MGFKAKARKHRKDAGEEDTKAKTSRKKVRYLAALKAVRTLPTNPTVDAPFQSTMPSRCGAPAATKCARAGFESASPATVSGRRKTRTTTCTDFGPVPAPLRNNRPQTHHFTFTSKVKGVQNQGVPSAVPVGYAVTNHRPQPHHQ